MHRKAGIKQPIPVNAVCCVKSKSSSPSSHLYALKIEASIIPSQSIKNTAVSSQLQNRLSLWRSRQAYRAAAAFANVQEGLKAAEYEEALITLDLAIATTNAAQHTM